MPLNPEDLFNQDIKEETEALIDRLSLEAFNFVTTGIAIYTTALTYAYQLMEDGQINEDEASAILGTIVGNVVERSIVGMLSMASTNPNGVGAIPMTLVEPCGASVHTAALVDSNITDAAYIAECLNNMTNSGGINIRVRNDIEEMEQGMPQVVRDLVEELSENDR